MQYNQAMQRSVFLILIVSFLCACHNSQKVTVAKKDQPKAAKTQTQPDAEYIGDNTAPVEIRALRDAKELQHQMNKKQEAEKEILKQRD